MDVKISQLPEPKHLTPGDLIPLVSHGDNVAITLEHFLFEISHILERVPYSALHIAKDSKVKALHAITKAQEAYTVAKNAYNASEEATQKVAEINEKTTTNAKDIATLKVDKVIIQAQLSNLEQAINSTADDLRITVITQVTPSSTKYIFKRGETIIATVVVPDVDTSLTMAGSSADAKATGDAIQAIKNSIPTKVSEFVNDANYLTESNANQKYLSKTEAQSIYLNQVNAENTYLSKTDASNIYTSKTEVAQTYLNKNDAKTTYVSKTDAQQAYYDKTLADEKFLTREDAAAAYPSKNDIDTKYLSKTAAADTYLTKDSAGSTYASKSDIASNYYTKAEVDNAISYNSASIYNYKGQCTYTNLPKEAENGDVWYVTDAHEDVPAGTNYAASVASDGTVTWNPLVGEGAVINYDTSIGTTSKPIAKVNGIEITTKRDQIPVVQGITNLNNQLQVLANVDGVDIKAQVVSDSTLSADSENSVQNKVVTVKINELNATLTNTAEIANTLNDKYSTLSNDVDTNKQNISNLDTRLAVQEQKEVTVICNDATIGTTLTTIATINGIDIKVKIPQGQGGVDVDTTLDKLSNNPVANSIVATTIEDLTNKYNDLLTKYEQLVESFEEITNKTVDDYFNS